MPWQDIDLYHATQLMNADGLNTLRDNLNYLLQPNFAEYHHPGTGSNYTVTDDLGADVDGTNFALTVESYGGPILAGFYGVIAGGTTSDSIRMAIIRNDPISHIGRNLFQNYEWEYNRNIPNTIGGLVRFDGLPAGSHTFKVIWGVNNGSTGATATLYVAHRPWFGVIAW